MSSFDIYSFNELSLDQLYRVLQLRVNVFVVEQDCPYPELDGKDQTARHILYEKEGEVLAYLRVLPPGERFDYPSIGRIIVSEKCRGGGFGHQLMQAGVDECQRTFPGKSMILSAQHHLQSYYHKHGFEACSDAYDEDGILHIDMLRKA